MKRRTPINRDTLLAELKNAVEDEFKKYLKAGGEGMGIIVICGYFLERAIRSLPKRLRPTLKASLNERINSIKEEE